MSYLLLACGGQEENFTPPPATIIRAVEQALPTFTRVEATKALPTSTATPLPMPPTRPPRPTVI